MKIAVNGYVCNRGGRGNGDGDGERKIRREGKTGVGEAKTDVGWVKISRGHSGMLLNMISVVEQEYNSMMLTLPPQLSNLKNLFLIFNNFSN